MISVLMRSHNDIAYIRQTVDALLSQEVDDAVEIISCPTCGRTEIDLIGLTEKVEKLIDTLRKEKKTLQWKKLAVMGCPVNGPGEARNADLGIAGSRNGQLIIFQKGKVLGAYPEAEAFAVFAALLQNPEL